MQAHALDLLRDGSVTLHQSGNEVSVICADSDDASIVFDWLEHVAEAMQQTAADCEG